MEHILLIGSEDVRIGANTIANAANEINRAASNIDEALHRHQVFLEEFITRLEKLFPNEG